MSKVKSIINNLKNNVYCRISRSKIHGVGVIAIKDIPKGINPFKKCNKTKDTNTYVIVKKKKLKKINNEVLRMLEDFLGGEKDIYAIPVNGLNALDISFFMNHSKKTNMKITSTSDSDFVTFITKRKIKKGEELIINYNEF